MAPATLAPVKLAFVRIAQLRLASVRLALVRLRWLACSNTWILAGQIGVGERRLLNDGVAQAGIGQVSPRQVKAES